MKLWLLLPKEYLPSADNPWDPWYDKAFGFVVRAETEEEARKLANEAGGAETKPHANRVYRTGGGPWLSQQFSICTELTAEGPSKVILKDEHWA